MPSCQSAGDRAGIYAEPVRKTLPGTGRPVVRKWIDKATWLPES